MLAFNSYATWTGQLTKLQTLSKFVISQNNCLDFRCHSGLNEFNGLNKLRGTLKIKGLRDGKEFASKSKDSSSNSSSSSKTFSLLLMERECFFSLPQ